MACCLVTHCPAAAPTHLTTLLAPSINQLPSWPFERPGATATPTAEAADVLTFGSSSGDDAALSPLSSLGCGSVGYGASRRIEEAINLLEDPTTRQQGLELLLAEQVHAEDAVSCQAWPQLCTVLPACLADEEPAVADGVMQLACDLVGQLLDCPEPLAALLLALLAFLEHHDNDSYSQEEQQTQQQCQQQLEGLQQTAAVVGHHHHHQQQQQQQQQRLQQQTAAMEASCSSSIQTQSGLHYDMLLCVLRALHRLGRSWHYSSPHHQIELAGALCRLLRQGLPRDGAHKPPHGAMSSMQALLQLEPQMLWWHRLAAVSSAAAPLAGQAHSTGLLAALAASIPLVQHPQACGVQAHVKCGAVAGVSAPCESASRHTDVAPLGASLGWLLVVHLCAYLLGVWTSYTPLQQGTSAQGQPELAAVVQCLMDAAAVGRSGAEGRHGSQVVEPASDVASMALALAHERNSKLMHQP